MGAIRESDLQELNEEERTVVQTVARFAEEVMRPVGTRLDRLPDPEQVCAPESELFEVFRQYRKLGVDGVSLATSELPPARRALVQAMIHEAMGWGDAGLAVGLEVSEFPRMLALLSGNPDLVEQFGDPEVIGCWPITEPDHGSDFLLYRNQFEKIPRPFNCVARLEGDHYVIRGQKSAWVSNGTIADAAALFCAVDRGQGPEGIGAFVVDLHTPGVRRGKPLDKLGQRALNQGEIFFDEVVVPAANLVIPPGGGGGSDVGLALANATMGATFVGLAQAAFDVALEFVRERRQGGGVLADHQLTRHRLFEMDRKIRCARALARAAMIRAATVGPDLAMSVAAKVTSTQTAFEVAHEAVQLHGGAGLTREHLPEKLLRDARASLIEDGSNEVLGLIVGERLVAR